MLGGVVLDIRVVYAAAAGLLGDSAYVWHKAFTFFKCHISHYDMTHRSMKFRLPRGEAAF